MRKQRQRYPVRFGLSKRAMSALYRGSYMRTLVLLNLINKLEKSDKCEACLKIQQYTNTNVR